MIVKSFPPIVNIKAKILILGSMPGKTSLEKNEYYGYKHNVFWKIMFDLFQTPFSDEYKVKKELLLQNKIALWDTLKYCNREGSLDSDIKNVGVNEFNIFLSKYKGIKDIFFNGKASFDYFKKYVGYKDGYNYYLLPSTSPANARIKFEEKFNKWKFIKETLEKNS